MCFKLLKNFYCCRYRFLLQYARVSNYLKISTVVDTNLVNPNNGSFKLLKNFYCCRYGAKSSVKIVSNYLKISTVVDKRN